jgi:hypothetical protein
MEVCPKYSDKKKKRINIMKNTRDSSFILYAFSFPFTCQLSSYPGNQSAASPEDSWKWWRDL